MNFQTPKNFKKKEKSNINNNSKNNLSKIIIKKQNLSKKKSQITIFIVLGIVVLIIFGLVNFVSNQSPDAVMEKKINKIYDDFLSSSNIMRLANDCLDRTANEALLLVGLQGGRIYDYQINDGYHISSFYEVIPYNYSARNASGEIYNVSYGIKAPNSTLNHGPLEYPYNGSLVRDVYNPPISEAFNEINIENFQPVIFANVSDSSKSSILPDLCNFLGPNDMQPIQGHRTILSCETASEKNKSIQQYIKSYIKERVVGCINFIITKTPQYNISTGNHSIESLIGDDDLFVSLNYPIQISLKNKPLVTKYLEFNIRPKIRIKLLHEIAAHLLGFSPSDHKTYSESNNIFFDITKDDPYNCFSGSAPCIIPGINISKLPDYCLNNNHCNFNDKHYNYSDIIIIEDNKSIINGNPYRFIFAIENRRPALDLIDESVNQTAYYYWYLNATYAKNLTKTYSKISGYPPCSDCSILISSADKLEIFPLGIDPDEDNLTYRYKVINSPTGLVDSDFESSNYYTGGVPGRKLISGFVSDYNISKDADLNAAGSVGDHLIIVNVSDNEGLYDYQNITIRVVP